MGPQRRCFHWPVCKNVTTRNPPRHECLTCRPGSLRGWHTKKKGSLPPTNGPRPSPLSSAKPSCVARRQTQTVATPTPAARRQCPSASLGISRAQPMSTPAPAITNATPGAPNRNSFPRSPTHDVIRGPVGLEREAGAQVATILESGFVGPLRDHHRGAAAAAELGRQA